MKVFVVTGIYDFIGASDISDLHGVCSSFEKAEELAKVAKEKSLNREVQYGRLNHVTIDQVELDVLVNMD